MRWKVGLTLVLTAACMVAVLWGLDLREAQEALLRVQWVWSVPMTAGYLIAHYARCHRVLLVIDRPVPMRRMWSINAIGYLAINVVPFRLGEVVRPVLLEQREGVPFGRGMSAVVLERLLDMVMLLVLLFAVTWFVDLPAGGLVVEGVDLVQVGQRVAGAAVAAGGLTGVFLVVAGRPMVGIVSRLPVVHAFAPMLARFQEGFAVMFSEPVRGLKLVLWTFVVWLGMLGGVASTLSAFPGLVQSLVEATWVVWALILTGTSVLPTPGFFGSYEASAAAALWMLGVDLDLGRTVGLVLHMGMFLFAVGLGAIYLLVEGVSLRNLVGARPAS